MAQYPKDAIRERILDAALHTFAREGYGPATMRQIARTARVSLGNVYRYFPSKEALFAEVLPASFVRELTDLIHRRVQALTGITDIATLGPDADFHRAAAALLRFSLDHRLRVVVLLGNAEDSPYAGFSDQLERELVSLATHHANSVGRTSPLSAPEQFALRQVYRSFVSTIVRILDNFEDEASIRCALRSYERYHLAGLKNFFEGNPP